MTPATSPGSAPADDRLATRLFRRIERIEHAADRVLSVPWLVIAAFTVIYTVPTVLLASEKLLWHDELYTLFLSTTQGWQSLLEALRTGADQHPPSFYYLTHLMLTAFGRSPLALRAPEIFGFWLMSVCLYAIVRRVAAPAWAVLAMVLPMCCAPTYYYASEARGYALVLGFSALALLLWMEIAGGRFRRIAIPLLALTLAAAVASHYYAAVILLPLGAGEVVRSLICRTIDIPVWIAFAAALTPVAAFIEFIRSAAKYANHFWATPVWSDVLRFIPHLLGAATDITVAGIAIGLGLTFVKSEGSKKRAGAAHPWDIAAFIGYAATPVAVMFTAKYVTHAYDDRYAIPGVIGITLLLVECVRRIARRTIAAVALTAVALAGCATAVRLTKGDFRGGASETASEIRMLQQTGDQPVVVHSGLAFFIVSFYAPRELTKRVTYVSDAALAVRYTGTSDSGYTALTPWFPLNIVPLSSYLRSNSAFFVFSEQDRWPWLTQFLPNIAENITFVRAAGSNILLSVKLDPKKAAAAAHAEPGSGKPMLYARIPESGPSLCTRYFGARWCPVIK